MSKQAFVLYASGKIVPGVLITNRSKAPSEDWSPVPATKFSAATFPVKFTQTGKLRAFIKYDAKGNVVPSSTIVREQSPKSTVQYQWKEIPFTQCCYYVPAAPANTAVPTITGTAQEGEVLTATRGTWTGTPDPTYTYKWQTSADGTSGWTDISGATTASYTVVAGDVDNYLRVVVTATNSEGTTSANSISTSQVIAAA